MIMSYLPFMFWNISLFINSIFVSLLIEFCFARFKHSSDISEAVTSLFKFLLKDIAYV